MATFPVSAIAGADRRMLSIAKAADSAPER